ncbi:MAG: hypothetical protein ACK5Q1_04820, partial [Limnobacter sp.]
MITTYLVKKYSDDTTSPLRRALGVARSYAVDNPYWYSENNTQAIDRDVIRLQAYHLLNLFLANHGLAYAHRFD